MVEEKEKGLRGVGFTKSFLLDSRFLDGNFNRCSVV